MTQLIGSVITTKGEVNVWDSDLVMSAAIHMHTIITNCDLPFHEEL